MARVVVRYWAGARRAAGVAEEELDAASVQALRDVLAARPAFVTMSGVLSYLVDGSQVPDDALLPHGAVVDVLPPFAGG
jgi:molybdopterin converting factor small subunit